MSRFALLLFVLLIAGCAGDPITAYVPEPYKVTIQQGNVITQEMVAKLRPGMSRSQVRFVLGTPPITDMFHANRWDYVYSVKQGKSVKEARTLSLFFEGDQLTRVAGDVEASTQADQAEAAATPAKGASELVLFKFDPNAPPPPPEKKGWFGWW